MLIDHAPVTGLTLLWMSISTKINLDRYRPNNGHVPAPPGLRTLPCSVEAGGRGGGAAAALPSALALLRQLALEAPPFGILGVSFHDIVLTAVLLVQMRALERRWGSNYFFAFLLTASWVGVGAVHALVTETPYGARLPVESLRLLSGAAALVTLAALTTRHLREIPTRGGWRLPVPGTRLGLTEKSRLVLPLLKLILIPDTQLQASTHRRQALKADVGFWTRVVLALIGVGVGVASGRPGGGWLAGWIGLLSRWVCRPTLGLFEPVLEYVFGPARVASHAVPPSQAASGPGAGARETSRRGGGVGAGGGGGYAALVAQLEEMGLPHTRRELVEALQATHGDVNAAIGLLLG